MIMKMSSYIRPPTWLLLLLFLNSSSNGQSCKKTRQRLSSNAREDGVVFLDNVLFTSPAKSKIHCATLCQSISGCVTYTYTPGSDVGSCRGYAAEPSSGGNFAFKSSAKTYTWERGNWLGQTCCDNDDCMVTNSECFKRKCLCTPGYYYSHRGQSCLEDCAEADLQTTYIHYSKASIWGKDYDFNVGMTAQQCQDWCSAGTWCRSVKYGIHPPYEEWCWRFNLTPRDVPADWYGEDLNDFYQKTCL